jgi:hypothetical protein
MARDRLRAIDEMIEKLTMESPGKTFEELSDLLQQEGRAVTGRCWGKCCAAAGLQAAFPTGKWIGFLKHLFYDRSHIARLGEVSIRFLLGSKSQCCFGRLGRRSFLVLAPRECCLVFATKQFNGSIESTRLT